MYPKLFLIVCCFICSLANAQKKITAVKTNQAPKVDGLLTEEVWKQAPVAKDFIINNPDFGKPSSQKTEVKIIYSNEAIYIGAYLYDDPKLIRKQLTSRDGERMQDCDAFAVMFDTYLDKQNAFQFLVTAANVQSDVRISPGTNFDYNWDAVWDSKITQTADGWIVEMQIPYMSLRFASKNLQNWGINFQRFIRRTNESSYWNPVNPGENGFVNQFGEFIGLENLQPPLRLSFLPYITLGYSNTPTANGNIRTPIHNGGMDVKWGVNESFTLDATLIPDFGQVRSDNVILNLSAFEQQFQEQRPFFTEGTELFNKAGIFYSRRIGGTPSGYFAARRLAADSGYTILKNPAASQLYNATKFSGRNRNKLGIGILNAIAAPSFAEFENGKGEKISYQTSVLTNYNILVLDQAFNNSRSSLTFTNTNVTRQGNARDANVMALDAALFNKKNTIAFKARPRYSSSKGSNDGFKIYSEIDKIGGKWQYGFWNNIESKYYNPNDLGILMAANELTFGSYLNWQQFTPNKHFNYRRYNFNIRREALWEGGKYTKFSYNANLLHVFKNFWDISLEVSGQAGWENDYFDLRKTGRVIKKTPWTFIGLFGSSDSRKKLFFSYGAGFANFSPIENDPFYLVNGSVRYRFNPKFSLDLSMRREDDKGNIGFSHFDAAGEPVAGRRLIKSVTSILSGVYNFKARMNLTFRARHYWSSVQYVEHYYVDNSGWWHSGFYDGSRDWNLNTFHVDMFFTWDFMLGSRLIAAYKSALGPDETVDGKINRNYFNNFTSMFNAAKSNEVSIRFIYFLDYNRLKKKSG
jgi:hypothetical protein